MRRSLPLLALAAALVLAAPASAALVFQRGFERSNVWIAQDDGSRAERLVPGRSPHISPDGQTVAFASRIERRVQVLRAIPAGGGRARTLLRRWQETAFAWSPDGATIATVAGRDNRPQRLVVIDVATGDVRRVARGYFSGVSFSPDSSGIVFGRSARDDQVYPDTDLWLAPVDEGAPTRLTSDGRSLAPVWGPNEIVYTRWERTRVARRQGGPQYNLWTSQPDGSNRRQLTHDRPPFLAQGLTPTAWSEDGTRLVAQFGGQDTSYAVAVDPDTGKQHGLGPQEELGILVTAISDDGRTVLGNTQIMGPRPKPRVVTIPWTGGRPSVIVRNALNADWSR